MDQSKQPSPQLYLVATPIGHLKDISYRAIETLKEVDTIYCEDTRITSRLLQAYQIDTPLKTYHEHNAESVRPFMIESMVNGQTIALVSDAGTPLISDPGYKLVKAAYNNGLVVSIIPGASAVVAALSVSGLPTDQFKFCGFLPHKTSARQTALLNQKDESCTLIYYESAKRLRDCLHDIKTVLGNRNISIVRELTKKFEEVKYGLCQDVIHWYQTHPPKGEIVICIAGIQPDRQISESWKTVIADLIDKRKAKELSTLIADISPYSKSQVYEYVLTCKKDKL